MGRIGKTGLQAIFQKLLAYFAPKESPVFTGTPKAPLPDGTETEQIATVGYVNQKQQTGFFEIDTDGNLMPLDDPVYSDDFELDEDGNIMPKEAA